MGHLSTISRCFLFDRQAIEEMNRKLSWSRAIFGYIILAIICSAVYTFLPLVGTNFFGDALTPFDALVLFVFGMFVMATLPGGALFGSLYYLFLRQFNVDVSLRETFKIVSVAIIPFLLLLSVLGILGELVGFMTPLGFFEMIFSDSLSLLMGHMLLISGLIGLLSVVVGIWCLAVLVYATAVYDNHKVGKSVMALLLSIVGFFVLVMAMASFFFFDVLDTMLFLYFSLWLGLTTIIALAVVPLGVLISGEGYRRSISFTGRDISYATSLKITTPIALPITLMISGIASVLWTSYQATDEVLALVSSWPVLLIFVLAGIFGGLLIQQVYHREQRTAKAYMKIGWLVNLILFLVMMVVVMMYP